MVYLRALFLALVATLCQRSFQEVTAALRATCLSNDKIPRPRPHRGHGALGLAALPAAYDSDNEEPFTAYKFWPCLCSFLEGHHTNTIILEPLSECWLSHAELEMFFTASEVQFVWLF